MFVFALVLLAHRAAAKCNGLAFNGTDAVSPIDVCMASMDPDGVPRSRKYVCQEGVGYVYAYNATLNCTGAKTSQTLPVMICDGEACPYVVTRNYYNNTEKCIEDGNTTDCTTTEICAGDGNDYFYDDAFIADRCLSIGDGDYGKATCDEDAIGEVIAVLDEYTTADCSGLPIDSKAYSSDAHGCIVPQLCNSSNTMTTTTDQPQGNGCKGVSLDNGQMYPLDVCSSTRSPLGNEAISQSRKTVCENGVGFVYAYSSEDCSGTPLTTANISEAFGTNATVSCDGETCPYLIYRTSFDSNYSCSADDGDNEYYGEVAMIVDQCMQSGGGIAYKQTCTSESTAVTNVYLSTECSGTPISSTPLLGNLSCAEITHCDVSGFTTTTSNPDSTPAPTSQHQNNGCKGVSQDNGADAIYPLDVCTLSRSPVGNQSILQSRKTVCQDDVGYVYTYSNEDCSGTPQHTTTNFSEIFPYGSNSTVFCDGDTCPYFIYRGSFDSNLTCSDSTDADDAAIIMELAVIVNRCTVVTDSGDEEYGIATCESGSAVFSTYDEADCSGTPNSTSLPPDDQPCVEITYCGSLDTTTPAPTDEPQGNGCKGVSLDGVDPVFPLDVCTQSAGEGNSQSTKYACQDGKGYVHTYMNLDCSGTPNITQDISVFNSNATAFCDGESCAYFILRTYTTFDENATCTADYNDSSYYEYAAFVDRCLETDGGYGEATCGSGTAVFYEYDDDDVDCSGTPVNSTSLPDDQPCVEITYCGSNAGDKKDDGVSVGVVVGAVIGGLCVIVIVGLLVFRLVRGQSAFKKDANERLMDGTEYNRL